MVVMYKGMEWLKDCNVWQIGCDKVVFLKLCRRRSGL